MKTRVETPQSRGRIGFARADVTPPIGIYHRMWGAALHDRAAGVHRPLAATAMYLEQHDGSGKLLVLGLDHCILDAADIEHIRAGVAGIACGDIAVSLSHTHGSGWMSRTRALLPGGDLIGPYLDRLAQICADVAKVAIANARDATIVYGTARCSLAAHRDAWDDESKQYVCGYNPDGQADDTVLVGRAVADESDQTLGTVVNYACHPTTLAWENSLINPDYIGAMREVIEGHTGAPCLFLQGASGDLGPREGFVGDPTVADRNGRQLGFAALSTLEALPAPGTHFEYAGPVVSGAVLGTWKHRRSEAAALARSAAWGSHGFTVDLPYRESLPTVEATNAELAKWEAEGATANAAGDAGRVSECRARAEQMTRRLARLAAMPPGESYPYRIALTRIGAAVWVFCPGELYQVFQTTLRSRFPDAALVIVTNANDWQPGYLPTAETYDTGIYQESIAAVARGSLEAVIGAADREIAALLG